MDSSSISTHRWSPPAPPQSIDRDQAFDLVVATISRFELGELPFDPLAQQSLAGALDGLAARQYRHAHVMIGWALQDDRSAIEVPSLSPPITLRQVRLELERLHSPATFAAR